jgi:hypothetical protein
MTSQSRLPILVRCAAGAALCVAILLFGFLMTDTVFVLTRPATMVLPPMLSGALLAFALIKKRSTHLKHG